MRRAVYVLLVSQFLTALADNAMLVTAIAMLLENEVGREITSWSVELGDGDLALGVDIHAVPALLLRGERLTQPLVRELAAGQGMTLVCGRYEGVDERVRRYVDREISAGDFVLSAGDPAAWCIVVEPRQITSAPSSSTQRMQTSSIFGNALSSLP